MRTRSNFSTRAMFVGWVLLLCSIAPVAIAQTNYITASPTPADLGFSPAASAPVLDSVNPVAGDLSLSIPMAKLPPGPGGFGRESIFSITAHSIRSTPISARATSGSCTRTP